jgi:hypothetical protein
MARSLTEFQTIRSQGGLLPPDLLRRILDPKEKLEGTRPEDYTLAPAERLNEVITQSWNRLSKYWSDFRASAAKLPSDEPATGLTNDKWTLPLLRELGFGLLPTTAGPEINGRTYPISRFFGPVPIHLVGCGLSLDRRAAGVRGASSSNPHGLVQEFLNRSSGHLWGIVSNGLEFRILRDSQALSRQSFLEFDLEAMFNGEVYSDFALFWMTAHASRFAPREENRPDTCFLECWTKIANEQGTRALLDLRGGVERALACLGEGFTSHPRNVELRDALRSGQLSLSDFHGQLLRIVYRLIFLFVAEDRSLEGHRLLHAIDESPAAEVARQRYASYYSLSRLRDMASRMKGSRHGDLWRQFRLVSNALSGLGPYAAIREQLALPALGSFLWSPTSTTALNSAEITNHDFLDALRNLAYTRQGSALRPVDYKNLGAEELGGVYESLLALTPQISADGARFTFAEFAGNERKTSGSYYTPDSLVQCLLDSALDPVVEQAIKGKGPAEAEKAILALKVCDPAVGSGHFLVGAAHRLARHLALQRSLAQGESEPSPLHYQHALRDVIGRCLYGVDINPMSAELCRVSLWLEALEPGKPLSFLDHHIQVGNSLLGATPALLAKGIPDEAFTPIEGDDKEICARFKRVNRDEHKGQQHLFAPTTEPWERLGDLAASMAQIDVAPDDSLESVQEKQRLYEEMVHSGNYLNGRFWADAWCAAFVWKKTSEFKYPITEEVFRRIENNLHSVDVWMRDEIIRLAQQYQFFHWHLAFPDVFRVLPQPELRGTHTGWSGGFDLVLGNPPWDKVQPEEVKFFASMRTDIAEASSAKARKDLIAGLDETDPVLADAWTSYKRAIDAQCNLLKAGKMLPLTAEGNLNTYRLFSELAYYLISPRGYAGMVVQTGMATDESGKEFFSEVLSKGQLVRFLDFENKGTFFSEVHDQFRFALITLCGSIDGHENRAGEFGWLLHSLDEMDQPERLVHLASQDIALFNPSSGTCPVFQSERDLRVNRQIYSNGEHIFLDQKRRFAAIDFLGELFNMTRDSRHFESEAGPDDAYLPLYEAKCIHQFDHRYAAQFGAVFTDVPVSQKENPEFRMYPRSWVRAGEVEARLARRGIASSWMFGFRDVASATNERTAIAAIFPRSAVGNNINLILGLSASQSMLLCANVNTFVFDFACRQKMSGMHVNIWIMKQLPSIPIGRYDETLPEIGNLASWVLLRTLELTYTSYDLLPLATELGHYGPPFKWVDSRRFLLRCELDALYFQLYGLSREDAAYIIDTFPIVKRRDEEEFDGDYRAKLAILEIYDAMAEAMRTGVPYQTRLSPPPADPSCRHPKKKIGILAYGSLISDPGSELEPRIGIRIKTQTPFPVEYGRISRTRGGAATLVPHEAGAPVAAEILVLDDDISMDEARNMLWRREARQEGSGKAYPAGSGENSVLVQTIHDDPCVETVLYTDFNAAGKITHPTAEELAKAAIESVAKADQGKDGISYLIAALESGIRTSLTDEFRAEILRQSGAGMLQELLHPASSLQ